MPNGELEGFEEFESDSDEFLNEAREKEITEEAFDSIEDDISVEDEFTTEFEELAEAVLYDDDAESENEYLGKLIAQAAKILPALKKSDKRLKSSASRDIVMKNLASDVYTWGKRLLRTRSKRLIQTAPAVLRRVMRIIEKKPDIILKKRGRIGTLLNRNTQKIAKGSAAR